MITVARVVIEHFVNSCTTAYLLHSPSVLLMAFTLALQALQQGYSVQETTASISPSNSDPLTVLSSSKRSSVMCETH